MSAVAQSVRVERTIALTGASGFVGSALRHALLAAGHRVLPFGRRPASALRAPIPGYVQWDLTAGPIALAEADVLVHCGAAVGQWGAYETFYRANVLGTQHAVASLRPDARVVYVSTASAYARHGSGTLREDAPLVTRGLSAYATTKAAADRFVLTLERPAVVLRPHVVYGPGDTTLWPRVLRAVRGGALWIPGNGTARISTTHIDHLAQAVVLAVQPSAPCGAFNIADLDACTVDALLRTMFARRAMSVRLRYVPRPVAVGVAMCVEMAWRMAGREDEPRLTRYAVQGLADDCVLDTTRAQSALGFTPRWTIADGPI